MDVRIGEIEATIVDSEAGSLGDAAVERIVRRVMSLIEVRERAERRSRQDRTIASPDDADIERYG